MVLSCLAVIMAVVLDQEILSFYWQYVEGPSLQNTYGFKATFLDYRRGVAVSKELTITGLTPGGPFERAGVSIGDIPFYSIGHGPNRGATGFYSSLKSALPAKECNMSFVSRADYLAGDWRSHPKRVVVSIEKQ